MCKINQTLVLAGIVFIGIFTGCGRETNMANNSKGTVNQNIPVIQSITVQGLPAKPNSDVTATVIAQSPQGFALTYTWTVSNGWTVAKGGNTPTLTIAAPDGYGISGIATITVMDTQGRYATGTTAISTQGNGSPIISSLTVSPNPVAPNGIITAMVTANDPDGDTLSYSWTATTGWSVTGYGTTATVVAPSTFSTGGYITVTVDDGQGGIVNGTLAISTEDNSFPVISSLTASPDPVAPNGIITTMVNATDSDGDTLSYSWTATTGWIVTGYGTTATVVAPSTYSTGGYITVTVDDGQGGVVNGSLAISTQGNSQPVISSVTASPNPIAPNGIITTMVNATDSDGDTLSYSWTATTGWIVTGYGTTATVVAPSTYSTGGYITVTVDDNFGGIVTGTIAVSTEANNNNPVIQSLSALGVPAVPGANITATVTAYSPQGYGLNYTWTVSDPTWLIKNGGATPTVTIAAPNTYGATGTATITVSDTKGGYAIGIVALSTDPLTPTTIPSAPTNLTAVAGNKQVSLTWSASMSATSYNVYTATTSGGPYTKVGFTSTTTYTITGLKNGTPYYFPITYYFVVTAVNIAGESKHSNEVSATPKPLEYAYTVGSTPMGIAIDSSGNVWVANDGSNNVTELNSSGAVIGTYDLGGGFSYCSYGIAIDNSSNEWVTNDCLNNVKKLNSSGTVIGTYSLGSNANADGIAIDKSGNIWIASYDSSTVTELNSSGTTIGTYAVGSSPYGIAIDASGNVWVANNGSSTVTKLNSSGTIIGTYPVGNQPIGIAIDASGNIWVADNTAINGSSAVTELNASGAVIEIYSVDTNSNGIAIDKSGNVWVTNGSSNNVTELVGVATGPQYWPYSGPQFPGGGNF